MYKGRLGIIWQVRLIIKLVYMIILQMLNEVPLWALERGLDEKSFEILESIVINPEQQDEILRHVEYGTACCIISSLEYARDKGFV